MSSSIPTGKAHVEAGVVEEGAGAFVGALVFAVAVSGADAEDSSVMVVVVVVVVVGIAMERKTCGNQNELGAIMVLLRRQVVV
jgi:hypothetical protein